jgi:hypothetical protein
MWATRSKRLSHNGSSFAGLVVRLSSMGPCTRSTGPGLLQLPAHSPGLLPEYLRIGSASQAAFTMCGVGARVVICIPQSQFCFSDNEVARVMRGATAWLLLVFVNRLRRVMWCLRVSVQTLVQNTNDFAAHVPAAQQGYPTIIGKPGNRKITIYGTSLADDPARVNGAGVVIPSKLSDPMPNPKPDVVFPVTAADDSRTRQKCTGEGPRDSYQQPFAWIIGQDIDGADTIVP